MDYKFVAVPTRRKYCNFDILKYTLGDSCICWSVATSLGGMQKQAPRRQIDKQRNIQLLAKYSAKLYGGDVSDYQNNHEYMDSKIKNDKAFPWQEIAHQLELDRWRLYHWYYETFQRMLAGSIERNDIQIMRGLIKDALLKDQPLDKPFQQRVKEQLLKYYHRSSFSIAFNNTKRQVMKELGKTEVPQPRQIVRLEQQQVQLLISQQLKLKQQKAHDLQLNKPQAYQQYLQQQIYNNTAQARGTKPQKLPTQQQQPQAAVTLDSAEFSSAEEQHSKNSFIYECLQDTDEIEIDEAKLSLSDQETDDFNCYQESMPIYDECPF